MNNRSLVLFTGYLCNYNCSYCAQKSNREFEKDDDLETINKKILLTVDKLCNTIFINEKIMKEYNNSLQIIGGEPTVINLFEVIRKLSIKKNYINFLQIFTNFSKDVTYYIELVKILNTLDMKVVLSISFHDEFISLNDFQKKIEHFNSLITNNKNVLFNIKMVGRNNHTVEYFDKFLSSFKNTNFKCDIVPVYSPSEIGKFAYSYVCNLRSELFNYILNKIIKQCNKKDVVKVYKMLNSTRKKGYAFSEKSKKVLPNLWIKYDGTISYPCKKIDKKISIENLNIDELYISCNNLKCQNYNECN